MVIPALGPGKVQLRLISLPGAVERLTRLREYLSAEELQRGNRLLDREKRDRFLAGRAILREILAGYLGEEPGSIRLSEGEFGKPHLSDHLDADSITFNLSHAGDLLLVAVAAGSEVGVDLEQVRLDLADLPYRTMAERYFSPREQEDLFSLPASEQIDAFYRCWTRKEAYLKGTGTGFAQPSNGFDMALLPDQPAALLAHRGAPAEVGKWSIRDIQVPQGYCAAVAVEDAGEIKVSFLE